MISPSSHITSLTRRDADFRLLVPALADAVVCVELVVREKHVWRPELVGGCVGEFDDGALREHGAFVGPWAGQGGRAGDGDVAERGIAEPCTVAAADDSGVVDASAITCAWFRRGIRGCLPD